MSTQSENFEYEVKSLDEITDFVSLGNNKKMYKLEFCRLTCALDQRVTSKHFYIHKAANDTIYDVNGLNSSSSTKLTIGKYKNISHIVSNPVVFIKESDAAKKMQLFEEIQEHNEDVSLLEFGFIQHPKFVKANDYSFFNCILLIV
jgi:hypothetical protein